MTNENYYKLDDAGDVGFVGEVKERTPQQIARDRKATIAYIKKDKLAVASRNKKTAFVGSKKSGQVTQPVTKHRAAAKNAFK